MNILDYIDWRGDITFQERPFNEVDNLVFSKLVYLKLNGVGSVRGEWDITVEDLYRELKDRPTDGYAKGNDPGLLLQKMAESERFRHVRIGHYVNETDKGLEIQFVAAAFRLGDGTIYIAFRGTDTSLAGWKEDFNMTFLSETAGQGAAVEYIREIAGCTEEKLRVGGHSKGGNFAEFGAAFSDPVLRDTRICEIYSNDGPGFSNAVIQSEEYNAILSRVVKIIPESSVVGLLLSGRENVRIVESDARGSRQHNPFSWCVCGTHFVETDRRTFYSAFMDEAFEGWGARLDDNEKRILVDTVYEVLDSSGADTLGDLKKNKIANSRKILKAFRQLDPVAAREIRISLRKLAVSSGKALKKEAFQRLKPGKAERPGNMKKNDLYEKEGTEQ